MALLYRFVKIQDRTNTHVFTFVVTKSVTRDLERDITSKEFMCGYQKWAITFSRTDKVLGVFLVWRNPSEGMRIYVDFAFTILNREHFSVNESFSGKQIKFTYESPAHGNRNYIPVNDLYSRNFTDPNGEFQIELTIGNVRTIYETHFRVSHSLFGGLNLPYQGDHQPTHTKALEQPKSQHKLESTYFAFGGFDWNITIFPHAFPDVHDQNKISFYLNRLTGFDHQCRVRYVVNLGEGEKLIDSGVVENLSDTDGKVHGWHPRVKFGDLVRKGVLKVRVEMIAANTISEVTFSFKTSVTNPPGMYARGLQTETLVANPQTVQCYDRDKQGWNLKTDCHSDMLRLHLVFKDIHNVPRNHLRYVSWSVYVLHQNRKTGRIESVILPGAPFGHYYAQENADEGIIIETDVSIKEKLIEGLKYSMTEHPVSEYGLMMNLTIRSIEKRDLGAYLCSSSNALGTASGAVRLQEIYMPPKTTISPKSNNNIHVYHKPTHSPKKSKLKPKKEEFSVTSSTTSEPRIYQTINPSISRPPFWVIEEEPSGGSSSKQFLCLPLMNVCSVAAAFWVPAFLTARLRFSIL